MHAVSPRPENRSARPRELEICHERSLRGGAPEEDVPRNEALAMAAACVAAVGVVPEPGMRCAAAATGAWAQKREKKWKKQTLTNEHIVFSECSNFTEALKATEEFGLRLLHLSKRGCLAS